MTYPIGSMYAIYGNIYHQYTPNVSINLPYMDPMGIGNTNIQSNETPVGFLYELWVLIYIQQTK